jgi:hypothetical protein
MASEREQSKRNKRRDPHERPGRKSPSKVDRDPNDIARFERPFECFEDLEDWQQPLRIEGETEESEDRAAHDRLRVQPGAEGSAEAGAWVRLARSRIAREVETS